MRQIAISVLSLFIALPAFADVRLPVVNIAAGGISARAAFGEPIVPTQSVTPKSTGTVASNSTKDTKKLAQDSVNVADTAARAVVPARSEALVVTAGAADTGEQIIADADVLTPRRPSSDLWAHASVGDVVPLRLPTPDEFSVIRSDATLPEENLDNTAKTAQTRVAVAPVNKPVSVNTETTSRAVSEPLSELDAQIARLNELQRRADESIREDFARANPAPRAATVVDQNVTTRRNVVARPTVSRAANIDVAPRVARSDVDDYSPNDTDDVTLSQMVVPMDDMTDDVVVRAVKKAESPRIASVRNDMTQMSPSELRKAFRKTFLSENKHLSTFQIDDRFDVASDMTANAAGFTSARDLSETGGIRPLEIKIKFRNDDAALSRDNYNLLTEYAGIVLSNPTRAVQVSIPQSVTTDKDDRKLAARRLAIIEQVLRDNGISEQRILPVLSQRDEEGLVLRMISLDQYETLTRQQRDIFGDTISKKTYRSMSW